MSHDYGWRDSCAAGGVTAMVVGSGALLGGSNMRPRGFGTRTASGEAKVRELRDVRKQLSVLDETPGPNVRAGTPIRALEPPCMTSGVGALNRAASYAALLSLLFIGFTPDLNCRIGAETPNVKDEPRQPQSFALRPQR